MQLFTAVCMLEVQAESINQSILQDSRTWSFSVYFQKAGITKSSIYETGKFNLDFYIVFMNYWRYKHMFKCIYKFEVVLAVERFP